MFIRTQHTRIDSHSLILVNQAISYLRDHNFKGTNYPQMIQVEQQQKSFEKYPQIIFMKDLSSQSSVANY